MFKGGFIYILTNQSFTVLYTGVTSNLANRVHQHKTGTFKNAFTSKYNTNILVYYEIFERIEDAIAREKQIKAGSQQQKIDLINKQNPEWKELKAPFYFLTIIRTTMYQHFFKRLIDFILAFIALTILSPILIPVVIGLLLTGEHYVFYFQKRIGYKNQPFNIWKFATMLKASPSLTGGLHTTRRDPRILPMGGFLRKTKINELPQIINILKGDMSIVGPRPLVDKTFDPYPEHVKKNIYNVKPGLTGIGSIIFRDEERLLSETTMHASEFYAQHISPYKGELELWYQKHLSFYTDFMLIFLTAWVIVSPESDLVYKVFKDLPERPVELK